MDSLTSKPISTISIPDIILTISQVQNFALGFILLKLLQIISLPNNDVDAITNNMDFISVIQICNMIS